MIAVVIALTAALRSTVRSHADLVVEILALRHQLAVLRRQAPVRLRLRRIDRAVWVVLSRVSVLTR
jgi:putative transposase